jgi:signal transduction histidine kinase
LERLQHGKVTRYQPQDNQPPTRFWALCAETNGTLWVGTMNGGLLRFRDGKFTRFTRADGLAADNISHILADNLGHLWLGSQAGVMCIDEASLVPADERRGPVACRLFGRSDGLPTVAMTLEFQPSCVKAHDGTLWFGSPKGTSWVNPADVRPIQPPPPVLLSAVLADGVARSFAHVGASAPPVISVEPGVKNIEVQFTSPEFTAPRLMRFKYRLDQLDPDWIDVGEQRSVTFNHLPAGEYTFRVMAQNSDGLWSGQPAAFRLVVRPYFWQRTSFLITALLFLLLSVALVVRRVTQQRLHRRLELLHHQQQIERERSRIAQDLHDDLGAGLTEISLTSDMATNPSLPEYESRQYTREIGARARELVQSMDEIVWAVNPRNDSVTSLSVYACQYAQRQLKPLNMACRLDVQPGLPELPLNAEQRYNFFLAFKEVINNIARHSGATEWHLAIHAEGRQLVFLIEDNGRGFEPGREAAGADGLLNIRERITRLGGECEIKSQPGGGTRVCLRVPLPDQTANRN